MNAWNSIHTINNTCYVSTYTYVTVDLHVFQVQIWQSNYVIGKLLLIFSDTFVSHIRASVLCLVLFVNQGVYTNVHVLIF